MKTRPRPVGDQTMNREAMATTFMRVILHAHTVYKQKQAFHFHKRLKQNLTSVTNPGIIEMHKPSK